VRARTATVEVDEDAVVGALPGVHHSK